MPTEKKPLSEKKKKGDDERKKAGVYYQSEENGNITGFLIALNECPKVDLTNSTDVEEAIKRYIDICYRHGFKPALTSFAVCAHNSRQAIQMARDGIEYTPNAGVMKALKEFYQICEAATREGMMQAKNPAAFIFEMKANYGWQETPRIVQIQQDPENETSIKMLADKYLNSVVVDDHQLIKITDKPIEEVESTAVIVEDKKE